MISKLIPGPRGTTCTCLVDDIHQRILDAHKWRADALGYVYVNLAGKHIHLHRLIMQTPTGLMVDHLNHNPLDNRTSNLRNVPRYLNNRNRKSAKRIHRTTSGRWEVRFHTLSGMQSLGTYANKTDAEKAVNKLKDAYINGEELAGRHVIPASGFKFIGSDAGSPKPWRISRMIGGKSYRGGSFPTVDDALAWLKAHGWPIIKVG